MIKKFLMFIICLCMPFTLAAQTDTYRLTDFFGGESTVRLKGKSASNDILSQHFVHTSSNKGLTDKKANEAFKILNEKRWEYGKKKGNTKL